MLSLFFFSLIASASAASTADWQKRTIYQVVTDRFAKTDGSGGDCDSAAATYCGGTWQGIVNKLDYIQALGFDAIWISPITKNIEGSTKKGEAYHGYWPTDFNSLNSNFGTPDDLKALASALHAKGMYLMVDIVVNHVAAANIAAPSVTYTDFATPFNSQGQFHDFCWITDYTNQTSVEQCWIGDNDVALVDINTESTEVQSFFNAWIQDLVSTYSIDGLRLDTVKHVQKSFFPPFLKSAGVFSIGEILDGDASYVGDYTNYMDSVFNYPEWFALTNAFGNSTGSISGLAQSVTDTKAKFKGSGLSSAVSFSENHDNPRLPSYITDVSRVQNIIAWTFVGDGIPTVYYGQEAFYNGGADPMNREALWFTSYDEDVKLFDFIKSLNQARQLAVEDASFLSTSASVVATTNTQIALQKSNMMGVFSNAGSTSGTSSWTVTGTSYAAGTKLVDVLSCQAVTVGSDKSVKVNFSNGTPQVYLPASSLSNGLCPTVSDNSAAADNSASASAPHYFPIAFFTIVSMLATAFWNL